MTMLIFHGHAYCSMRMNTLLYRRLVKSIHIDLSSNEQLLQHVDVQAVGLCVFYSAVHAVYSGDLLTSEITIYPIPRLCITDMP
jgi:hypothetical protein